MSRDPEPGSGPDYDDPQGPPPPGRIRPTSAAALTGFALVGLVLGWALHPVSVRLNGAAPTVGLLPILALALVAVVIGLAAWSTHRTLQRGRGLRLEPHQAVNRLVLGKTCALVGALVAGGYLGYALSWVGVGDADLARQRVAHSLIATACGVLIVVGSLLLERACRVKDGEK